MVKKSKKQKDESLKFVKVKDEKLSTSQSILNGMFGGSVGKRVLGDTRPKLIKTLQGGNDPYGLIKNRDNGYTQSLFLPSKSGRINI